MKATPQVASRSRRIAAATVASALALGLAACGDSSSDKSTAGGDEQVNLTFAWWGSDTRHEVTQKVIDEFEKKHSNIKITPDYTSWDNYFEKLNVAAAGGDLPDVITQEERFLTEYADRGLLADLKGLGLDTTKIDDTILQSGTIDDKLFGVATGINVHGVVADKAIFDEVGVALPDDSTWTWQDYVDLANEISEKSGGKYYGVQNNSFNEVTLKILARQKGEEVFTKDGTIGVSEATVTEWFERSLALLGKGSPDASVSTEIQGAGVEGSLPATNKGAMAWFWSNQLPAISSAAGRDLVILKAPGETEGTRTGQYFKPTMFYSASAKSEHPEEAKLFIDFLINSEEAGKLILTDRGLPANTDVRDVVVPLLGEADKVGADFVASLEGIVLDGTPVPPVGSGQAADITGRVNSDVMFGTITPAEGAARWIQEMSAAIS